MWALKNLVLKVTTGNIEEALTNLIDEVKRRIESESDFVEFMATHVALRKKKEDRERGVRYVGFKEGRIHAMRQILRVLESMRARG